MLCGPYILGYHCSQLWMLQPQSDILCSEWSWLLYTEAWSIKIGETEQQKQTSTRPAKAMEQNFVSKVSKIQVVPKDGSPIPRACMVEGQTQFQKVILYPLHACWGSWAQNTNKCLKKKGGCTTLNIPKSAALCAVWCVSCISVELCMCTCLYVCMSCTCRYLQSPEEVTGCPGAGVTFETLCQN